MTEKLPFNCPAIAARVTLSRQTFVISSIGSSTAFVQREHDCSGADTCPHRYTEACRVQKLNR